MVLLRSVNASSASANRVEILIATARTSRVTDHAVLPMDMFGLFLRDSPKVKRAGPLLSECLSRKTDRLANALHDLIGDFVCALCSALEHAVDVRLVGQNFFAPPAHRREIFPNFLEKL